MLVLVTVSVLVLTLAVVIFLFSSFSENYKDLMTDLIKLIVFKWVFDYFMITGGALSRLLFANSVSFLSPF